MPTGPMFLRGALVPLIRDLSRAQVSAERWNAFLATLPPEAPWRRIPGADDWVRATDLVACEAAFSTWAGLEPRRVRGAVLAELMFGNAPEAAPPNPTAFLRGVHELWTTQARGLIVTLEHLLPQEALVRVEAEPPDPAFWPGTVAAWFRRALELHGAEAVVVEALEAKEGVRYRLRWSGAPEPQ